MKKIMTLGLITILLVSLLAAPTFAAKPENPGNSNKTEKIEKSNSSKADKTDKADKGNSNKKDQDTTDVEEDTTETVADDTTDDADDEEKIVVDDEDNTADKVGSFLKKWQKRYTEYNGEENATADDDENQENTYDKKNDLPPGLAKKGDNLPPGLAAKEELPYGLLKRIDPDAIPKGQITDEITGEAIDIEQLLSDSASLLESAVEGDGLGEYFPGSIEDYDEALTAYTDLVNAGESTEEELIEAAETLNDAYNDFIMSRTATLDELKDYNSFLEEVDEIIDGLEIGSDEGEISVENYDALVAYFDTLEPYNVITDEDEDLTPDAVSIEAMLTLYDNATEKFDKFMGYKEAEDDTEEE